MSMGSQAFRGRRATLLDPLPRPKPVAAGRIASGLPSKEVVDYVHSLTQTTLLLIGVVVFAVLHRRRPGAAVRKLTGRVA